MIKTTKDN